MLRGLQSPSQYLFQNRLAWQPHETATKLSGVAKLCVFALEFNHTPNRTPQYQRNLYVTTPPIALHNINGTCMRPHPQSHFTISTEPVCDHTPNRTSQYQRNLYVARYTDPRNTHVMSFNIPEHKQVPCTGAWKSGRANII